MHTKTPSLKEICIKKIKDPLFFSSYNLLPQSLITELKESASAEIIEIIKDSIPLYLVSTLPKNLKDFLGCFILVNNKELFIVISGPRRHRHEQKCINIKVDNFENFLSLLANINTNNGSKVNLTKKILYANGVDTSKCIRLAACKRFNLEEIVKMVDSYIFSNKIQNNRESQLSHVNQI
jgi:hypothetical protein